MFRLFTPQSKLFFLGLIFFITQISVLFASTNNVIYWYENGKKVKWEIDNSRQYYKLNEEIKKLRFASKTEFLFDKVNENVIAIDQSLSDQFTDLIATEAIIPLKAIQYQGEESNFLNHTYYIDNVIMIQLNKGFGFETIEKLEKQFNIKLTSEAFQAGATLLFKNLNKGVFSNSAVLSAAIYENEHESVKEVQPNRINFYNPMGTVNDANIGQAWFLENSGESLLCSSVEQVATSDAYISQAWTNGATGNGVRVAVIDFYGFDYSHPEMQGQMIDGWDCIKNKSYNSSNYYYTSSSQAHGMAVAGIIAAKANNGIGSAGVAYDSKLIPLLIDGSEASVVIALQKAISNGFDADVINCSFGSYFPSPAIKNEIDNVIQFGRDNKGTIVVASHGNDYYDDKDYPQYPSAYEEVISVGASTPDDKTKTPGDGWDVSSAWGSNFGDKVQLVAPGVCIFTTDLSGNNGYSNSDFISFQKTSAAAPIVSGVVALMIGQNNTLMYNDVVKNLFDSADKINSTKYDYNYNNNDNGRSREAGYGRVNALKAIGGTPVGMEDVFNESDLEINLNTLVHNDLQIKVKNNTSGLPLRTRIMDISGKTVYFQSIKAEDNIVKINTNLWASGMYIVQFEASNHEFKRTYKVVKTSH